MTRKIFYFAALFASLFTLHSSLSFALPRKGFYEGPYVTLSGGLMQFDWDVNQKTKVREGSRFEPVIALGFGWNVYDWLAPELFLRYTTDSNEGRREHIAAANVGLAFTWIAKPLLDFEKWRILPFIKPGLTFQIAALPGDVDSNDKKISTKGFGPSLSGGVRFTFKKYLYFGVEVGEELLFHEGQAQLLTTGGSALIYKGGWKSQMNVFTMVGIHY